MTSSDLNIDLTEKITKVSSKSFLNEYTKCFPDLFYAVWVPSKKGRRSTPSLMERRM